MTKSEFLNGLKEALVGEMSATEINSQLLYYERYIEEELRSGKTEQEVLFSLGEPRLIAKTIIETKGINSQNTTEYYETNEKENNENSSGFHIQMNGIWGTVTIVAIIVLVLVLVFSVLKILLPIVLPIVVFLLIISWIKRRID